MKILYKIKSYKYGRSPHNNCIRIPRNQEAVTTDRNLPFLLSTDTTEDSELDNQKISGELPSSHLQLKSVENIFT